MKKIVKLICSTGIALAIAGVIAGISYSEPVQAADGCGLTVTSPKVVKTRRVVKLAGGGSWPQTCKLQYCMRPDAYTIKGFWSQPDPLLPPKWITTFYYEAVSGTAPTNWCPSDVLANGWINGT